MENPDDAVAKTALDNLNMKIEKNNQNTMHDGPQDDFTIRYGLFIGNFQIARKSLDVLKEHPQDAEALKRIEKINKILTKINKRYDYPAEWITKPTLKTKTEAWRPGLTRKGEPILAYRTIGVMATATPGVINLLCKLAPKIIQVSELPTKSATI